MKFKSALVTSASGSVGGFTASHNKGGLYLRARSIPTDPGSEFQQVCRNAMATLAAWWRDYDNDSERLVWGVYAENTPLPDSFGDPRPIPGLAMFCRCNVPRIQAGVAPVYDGPRDYGTPSMTLPTVGAAVATQTIQVGFTNTDAWAAEDGGYAFVYASRPQSTGVEFFKGPYRYAGKIAGNDSPAPTSPASIAAPFAFEADQRVFVMIRVSRADGRLSHAYRFQCHAS